MANIILKALSSLLEDMQKKQRTIELFPFNYNGIECIVFLTLLEENDKRKRILADLEFIKVDKEKDLILDTVLAKAEKSDILFYSKNDFYNFFNINKDNSSGNARIMFDDFTKYFAGFIPKESTIKEESKSITKKIMSKLDPNNPNAIYCYDVRRSGNRKDGKPKKRSLANSEKAQRRRLNLFNKYQQDETYSFYFSDNLEDEKSDIEIMQLVANRKSET